LKKRLRDKLSGGLPSEELLKVYNSFDVVGDIAIIKIPSNNTANSEAIAKQIISSQKNIKTVLTPVTRITGDYRVRKLKLLAGENKTSTTHKESRCTFKVDVEKCYFSPRLSHEHTRIANLVQCGETVVNMFAGVGCFSVIIAKTQSKTKVYSIDVNPTAVEYMEENVKTNQVDCNVFPMLGDAKDIIQTQLQGVADRVLMPLPEKALEYLPYALLALKQTGGWIHYYDFQHAPRNEDPIEKTKLKISQKLEGLRVCYVFASSRVMRPTGPNWYQTVIDIQVTSLPSKF
jgi:tRNA (guanine37-N1)-methyltransferase